MRNRSLFVLLCINCFPVHIIFNFSNWLNKSVFVVTVSLKVRLSVNEKISIKHSNAWLSHKLCDVRGSRKLESIIQSFVNKSDHESMDNINSSVHFGFSELGFKIGFDFNESWFDIISLACDHKIIIYFELHVSFNLSC